MRYRLHTLVDITKTNQYRNELGKEQARNQQQNFDTMLNTLGMRANIIYNKSPELLIDFPYKYGLKGKDLGNIWQFDWEVEREFLFLEDSDDVALLKKDFALVPYISGLTETTEFKTNLFMPTVNISFEKLR